jgi:hypothetical protein
MSVEVMAYRGHTITMKCECGFTDMLFAQVSEWDHKILIDFLLGECVSCGAKHFISPRLDVLVTLWDTRKWENLYEIVDFISDQPSKESMV